MIGFKRHPSWRELNRLADGVLDGAPRRETMEHLAGCQKCARDLSLLRDLRAAGRDMRHPSPPRDLLDDILQNRADGARVILPAVPPSQQPRRRLVPAVAAAALVAALAGLASLVLTSDAGAGSSELAVEPAAPVPAEQVRFTYTPGSLLAGESELKLRLRLRQPNSEPPRQLLGDYEEVILHPDGEGRYTAEFRLPADLAYANMAVESLDGVHADDRGGRLWSLRAHAEDGTPLQGALRQEFLVLQSRSWPEAEAVLHEMKRLYPERAEGWSLQLVHEELTQLPDEFAANLASHREIFRNLQHKAQRSEPSIDETAALARYAWVLGEEEALALWLARVEDMDPAHRLVVSYRVARLDPGDADAYLERLWSEHGSRSRQIYLEAFQRARSAGDAEAARRWAGRGLTLEDDPIWKQQMALALVADEATRNQGVRAIRNLLAQLEEADTRERPLDTTPEEYLGHSRRLRSDLLTRLAEQFLESDRPEAAIRELDAADEIGIWSPSLFRARLDAHLRLGQPEAAVDDFWRLEVDPVYPRDSVDSLRGRLPVPSGMAAAEGRLRANSELMHAMRAQRDMRRGLPSQHLVSASGEIRSLENLVGGRPTVLLLWDRRVHQSRADVEQVVRAVRTLSGGPGQLLWVNPEPHSESLQAFKRSFDLSLPAYFDPGSELALSLGEWGSLEFFVIDRAGVIRARTDSLMEAVRHVEVLIRGSRDTA